MECPLCHGTLESWRQLHRHLVDEHGDAIELRWAEGDAPPVFRAGCPACAWTFEQVLRGQRRDAAFLVEHRREMSRVAFDQLMLHWAEEHMADAEEEAAVIGGNGGAPRVTAAPSSM